jgi:hypothetical protein
MSKAKKRKPAAGGQAAPPIQARRIPRLKNYAPTPEQGGPLPDWIIEAERRAAGLDLDTPAKLATWIRQAEQNWVTIEMTAAANREPPIATFWSEARRRAFAAAERLGVAPPEPSGDPQLDLARLRKRCLADSGKAKGQTVETPPEPLPENAALVLEILQTLPPHRAMTGPQILDALAKRNAPLYLDESTLTRRVIPALAAYHVKNKPRVGYYIAKSR